VTTPQDVLAAAKAWYAMGACVIPPVHSGKKAPLVDWKVFQSERPAPERMASWYTESSKMGVGILCGKISGNLEMLELEGAVQNDADFICRIESAMNEAGLDGIWESLHAGYHEFTPSGGLHLIYRITDHPVPGNTKIAQRPKDPADWTDRDCELVTKYPATVIMETLIETRGEGGYVVVAPSQGPVHPSGNPWTLGFDSEPGAVPEITWEQREALVEVLAKFDVPRPRKERATSAPARPKVAVGTEKKVGDDFNERGDWAQILEPHGWTYHSDAYPGIYWERPGGSSTGGHSASTGRAADQDRMYVWSSATPLPTHEPMSKFFVYTELNHHGDFKAATKDLAAQGYGEQRIAPPKPPSFGNLVAPVTRDFFEPDQPATEVLAAYDAGAKGTTARPPVYLPPPGRETHTDVGTANRFLREHPQQFLYVAGDEEWRWYDGVVWQVDTSAVRVGYAIELMINRMADEAAAMLNDPNQSTMGKSLDKYVRSASMDSGRRGLLRTLASKNTIARKDLDPHLHLLGLLNGVLDTRTGEVIASRPEYLLTKQMDVAYDPAAEAPQTREYMKTMLPEAGLREFTQRALGYTMTGEQDQRAFIIAHGPRGSGKSQFVELWGKMFGGYATVAADAAFRKKERGTNGPSAELHALQGYRFVWSSENDEDVVFDGDIVKRICGGESMSTRTLYEKRPSMWRPECVVWLATNNFPRFPAEEEAVWDRVKPIGFDANFDRDGSGHQRILSISAKLHREEASGILNLMIGWLKTYRELGWIEPDTLTVAIQDKKVEGDPVAQFWMDHVDSGELVQDADAEINFAALYQHYANWSQETLGQKPRGSRRFGAALRVIVKYGTLRKNNGKTYLPGWKKMNYSGVTGSMGAVGSG
jgi:putative DNA primase/helicase